VGAHSPTDAAAIAYSRDAVDYFFGGLYAPKSQDTRRNRTKDVC